MKSQSLPLGENIRKYLKMKGLTQQQLADRIGISRVYLSDLIRGKKGKRIPQETLNKIAQALGVSVAELLATPEEKKDKLEQIEEITDTVLLPVIGDVPAGGFVGGDIEVIDYLPTPKEMIRGIPKDYIRWWRVWGDSMEPEISRGDYVLVADGSFVSINNGDKVIAIYDGERTLKKFYEKDDHIILQPINPDHEPLIIDKEDLDDDHPLYLYKVLGVLKRY